MIFCCLEDENGHIFSQDYIHVYWTYWVGIWICRSVFYKYQPSLFLLYHRIKPLFSNFQKRIQPILLNHLSCNLSWFLVLEKCSLTPGIFQRNWWNIRNHEVMYREWISLSSDVSLSAHHSIWIYRRDGNSAWRVKVKVAKNQWVFHSIYCCATLHSATEWIEIYCGIRSQII